MYLNQEAKLNHASNKINLAYYLQPSILCDVMLLFYSVPQISNLRMYTNTEKPPKYVVTNVLFFVFVLFVVNQKPLKNMVFFLNNFIQLHDRVCLFSFFHMIIDAILD